MPNFRVRARECNSWDVIVEADTVEDARDGVQKAINEEDRGFLDRLHESNLVDGYHETEESEQLGAGWSAEYFVTELGNLINWEDLAAEAEAGYDVEKLKAAPKSEVAMRQTLITRRGSRVRTQTVRNYILISEKIYGNGNAVPGSTMIEKRSDRLSTLQGVIDRLRKFPPKADLEFSIFDTRTGKEVER